METAPFGILFRDGTERNVNEQRQGRRIYAYPLQGQEEHQKLCFFTKEPAHERAGAEKAGQQTAA